MTGKHIKVDHALVEKLMRQGLSRSQIAARTGYCPSTVSYTMKNIRDRQNAPTGREVG